MRLIAKALANGGEDVTLRRQHADDGQRPRVYHDFAIHQHCEFPIVSVNHVHVDAECPTKMRRHPDGLNPRDSIGAVTDGDTRHASSRSRRTWTSASR
jgi:hypothetical protein